MLPPGTTELAALYEVAKSEPNNPAVRVAYQAFIQEVKQQFDSLPVEVTFTKVDPYKTSIELFKAIDSGRFEVFTGGNTHPIMSEQENAMFRAVHDYYGHYLGRNSFSPNGEYEAWLLHRATFPPEALPALCTETRAQSAYYAIHKEFPEQKATLMPARFW